MRAITLAALDAAPALADLPAPTPTAGEVLVRVQASSANPVDNAIAAGMLAAMFEHEFPVTLGRDYAGVIAQVGEGVTRWSPGDEVYGFVTHARPTVRDGAWAELVRLDEGESIARRPAGLDVAEAGAAPLAGITALALIDALAPSAGEALLVVGATGGVGSFAVQLAARAGAHVLATGRPDDAGYLRGLGASVVVDRDGDVAAAVREHCPEGVDAVVDVVSYEPGAFDALLAGGGRLASSNGAAGEGAGRMNVLAAPAPENLDRLSELLGAGALKVHIQRSYALEHATAALSDLASSHTQGKLAISFD